MQLVYTFSLAVAYSPWELGQPTARAYCRLNVTAIPRRLLVRLAPARAANIFSLLHISKRSHLTPSPDCLGESHTDAHENIHGFVLARWPHVNDVFAQAPRD